MVFLLKCRSIRRLTRVQMQRQIWGNNRKAEPIMTTASSSSILFLGIRHVNEWPQAAIESCWIKESMWSIIRGALVSSLVCLYSPMGDIQFGRLCKWIRETHVWGSPPVLLTDKGPEEPINSQRRRHFQRGSNRIDVQSNGSEKRDTSRVCN